MMNRYLIQAPTVIVIGVAGAATWPSLFPEGERAPTKGRTKPPPMETYSPSAVGLSGRDPFHGGGSPEVARTPTPKGPSSKETVEAKAEKQPPPKPVPADGQDVDAMRLGGIYIGGSAPIAIIDDQVYSLGEQLRKADGSPLPYVIARIGKDRAVLRKGRQEFVIGFSDDPEMAAPRAPAPAIASNPPPPVNPGPGPLAAGPGSRPKGLMSRDRAGGDTASMLLRLLSGLGGSSGGLGGGGGGGGGVDLSMLSGLLGGAAGGGLGSAGNTPVNSATLQTGLDALMGKFDNVGQGGLIPGQSGGTNP